MCGGGDKGLNVGWIATVGAFAGGRSAPGAVGGKTGNVAGRAYAGFGFSGLFSPNATQVSDFDNEFRSEAVDLGIGPINGSVSYSSGLNAKGGAVDVLAVTPPFGSVGIRASCTLMTTGTITQELWSQTQSPK